MLHLDFSCTQRLMTPVSSNTQKDSLEDRVCAIFSSVFLLVDAGFHLLAAAYKGFAWTVVQISCKNPSDYYKEAYSHFVKALSCTSMVPFALVGFICPSALSKKLQEYLGWKSCLKNTSGITKKNKELEKELQSKNEEIDKLQLQVDLLKERTLNTSQNNLPPLEESLVSAEMTTPDFSHAEDLMSVNSDSDDEFVDAEDPYSLIETLKRELQLAKGEIERLNKQSPPGLALFSTLKDRLPYNQLLLIKKFAEKDFSSAISIYKYASADLKEEIDDTFREKLQADFCNLSNIEKTTIVQVFEGLLPKHNFSSVWHPVESALSTVINSFI